MTHLMLSSREKECLRLLVRGLSNKEISGNLGITYVMVRKCVEKLRTRLGAHDKNQVAMIALREGLVELPTIREIVNRNRLVEICERSEW